MTEVASVTREVAASLRGRITHGELRPGERLPSERALALRLGVSRVTVVRALTRLRTEGLVVTRHGSGTFVAATERLQDMIGAHASPVPLMGGGDDLIDLRWATTAGPVDVIAAVTVAATSALPAALSGDGTAGGLADDLTGLLAAELTRDGLPTRPDQLTLTSGAMAGLGLVLDAVPTAGRLAIAETPTYPAALRLLAQRGRRTRGWPAGPAAWDAGYLGRLMRTSSPGVLYLQPDGHNPTGAVMPPATRDAVAAAAAASGWVVVADETMRPLTLTARRPASLAARHDGVIVVASMSKTVWGGLHLGWVRAPAAMTRRLRAAGAALGAGPSALDQITAAQLLPGLEVIIERRRRLLAENLGHLEQCLRGLGTGDLRWHRPAGGITLWADLRGRSSYEVVQQCARRGVLLEPASTYAVGGRHDRHLRIPFTMPPAVLDRIAEALGQALDSVMLPVPGLR
jgi:DNA-binding transcriptional MocR family regulator